jgi:D-alanine-D-alanine ligase
MNRIRVAILRGGLSEEYTVSLMTGAAVLECIDQNQFDPIDVVISKCGEWLVDGRVRLPEHVLHCVDVVFIALHGTYGEDGTLQRFLDRFCVPYTGSKAFASSIAMNKLMTKNFLKDASFKFPKHWHVRSDVEDELGSVSDSITALFGPEYIIKPVASGSSVGAMRVKNQALLRQAMADALDIYDEIMVEEYISGKEATCGVVERFRGESFYALPPIEIVKPESAEFFDQKVKYDGSTKEYCPARFQNSTKNDIETYAKHIHETLGLSQYSRSDFIIGEDGIYFLEVNTLPGLTKKSLFPKALEAIGTPYSEFVTHLLTDAMNHK